MRISLDNFVGDGKELPGKIVFYVGEKADFDGNCIGRITFVGNTGMLTNTGVIISREKFVEYAVLSD